MIEVPIYNQSGEKISSLSVDEQKLGGAVNNILLKQALVMYHANKRQGTVRTQARGEVAGSTRKMFRQKGTGNARTGGIRNPIKRGGGHAKQKRPKDWRIAMPKKQRRLACQSALLSKFQAGDVRVVDQIVFPAAADNASVIKPKTKVVVQMFKALGIDRTVLLAINGRNEILEMSARNVERTTLTTVEQLNAWDLLKNRTLLVTKDGLEQILA